jgi:hypothetical protein
MKNDYPLVHRVLRKKPSYILQLHDKRSGAGRTSMVGKAAQLSAMARRLAPIDPSLRRRSK